MQALHIFSRTQHGILLNPVLDWIQQDSTGFHRIIRDPYGFPGIHVISHQFSYLPGSMEVRKDFTASSGILYHFQYLKWLHGYTILSRNARSSTGFNYIHLHLTTFIMIHQHFTSSTGLQCIHCHLCGLSTN